MSVPKHDPSPKAASGAQAPAAPPPAPNGAGNAGALPNGTVVTALPPIRATLPLEILEAICLFDPPTVIRVYLVASKQLRSEAERLSLSLSTPIIEACKGRPSLFSMRIASTPPTKYLLIAHRIKVFSDVARIPCSLNPTPDEVIRFDEEMLLTKLWHSVRYRNPRFRIPAPGVNVPVFHATPNAICDFLVGMTPGEILGINLVSHPSLRLVISNRQDLCAIIPCLCDIITIQRDSELASDDDASTDTSDGLESDPGEGDEISSPDDLDPLNQESFPEPGVASEPEGDLDLLIQGSLPLLEEESSELPSDGSSFEEEEPKGPQVTKFIPVPLPRTQVDVMDVSDDEDEGDLADDEAPVAKKGGWEARSARVEQEVLNSASDTE